MANVTASELTRNEWAVVTANDGAASQTVVYDRGDEDIHVIINNGDAADAAIIVRANGFGAGGDANDYLTVVTAGAEVAFVGESNKYKDPDTQAVTIEILESSSTITSSVTFSGTVSLVKVKVIESPKGVTN